MQHSFLSAKRDPPKVSLELTSELKKTDDVGSAECLMNFFRRGPHIRILREEEEQNSAGNQPLMRQDASNGGSMRRDLPPLVRRDGEGSGESGDAYRTIWVAKVDLELTHGADNGNHALNCVAVDDRFILQTFFLRITLFVDDSERETAKIRCGRIGQMETGLYGSLRMKP